VKNPPLQSDHAKEIRSFVLRAGLILAAVVIVIWVAWFLPRGQSSKVVIVPLDAPRPLAGSGRQLHQLPPGDPGEATGIVVADPVKTNSPIPASDSTGKAPGDELGGPRSEMDLWSAKQNEQRTRNSSTRKSYAPNYR